MTWSWRRLVWRACSCVASPLISCCECETYNANVGDESADQERQQIREIFIEKNIRNGQALACVCHASIKHNRCTDPFLKHMETRKESRVGLVYVAHRSIPKFWTLNVSNMRWIFISNACCKDEIAQTICTCGNTSAERFCDYFLVYLLVNSHFFFLFCSANESRANQNDNNKQFSRTKMQNCNVVEEWSWVSR